MCLESGNGTAGQGQFLTRILAQYPAILDLATYLSLNKLFGMNSIGVERRYASNSGHWPKSVCIASTLVCRVSQRDKYHMAWKGKLHAVCAVSACQPGCRQVLCRVCQPFRPNLWVMRDAEPLRCSLLRSLRNPTDRRGDSHASPPATATRGTGRRCVSTRCSQR